MIIKERIIKFVSIWVAKKNGGVVLAKIEFATKSTKWISRKCDKIEKAEIIAESLFNRLRDMYL